MARQKVRDHQEAQAPVPLCNYSAEFEAARLNENNLFGRKSRWAYRIILIQVREVLCTPSSTRPGFGPMPRS